jgi:hypothetical protein
VAGNAAVRPVNILAGIAIGPCPGHARTIEVSVRGSRPNPATDVMGEDRRPSRDQQTPAALGALQKAEIQK